MHQNSYAPVGPPTEKTHSRILWVAIKLAFSSLLHTKSFLQLIPLADVVSAPIPPPPSSLRQWALWLTHQLGDGYSLMWKGSFLLPNRDNNQGKNQESGWLPSDRHPQRELAQLQRLKEWRHWKGVHDCLMNDLPFLRSSSRFGSFCGFGVAHDLLISRVPLCFVALNDHSRSSTLNPLVLGSTYDVSFSRSVFIFAWADHSDRKGESDRSLIFSISLSVSLENRSWTSTTWKNEVNDHV